MKNFLCFVCLLCLCAFCMTASAEETYLGNMQVVNCENWVSLRARPDTDSPRLEKVPLGAGVTNCYAYDGEFIYAEYNGRCGFILAEYLVEDRTYVDPEDYVSTTIINCGDWTFMYAAPGFEAEIIQNVPAGATVTVCWQENEDYSYCCYNGLYGYIDNWYLQPDEDQYTSGLIDWYACRLNEMYMADAAFGVYLICDTMGGDWSVIQEKHHLINVLNGMPDELDVFAKQIPDERIIEFIGGTELYLIIPAEGTSSVSVNRLKLGYDGFTGEVEEVVYYSEGEEPILVRCNVDRSAPDCEIIVTDYYGNVVSWYPGRYPESEIVDAHAYEGNCLDFTVYPGE